MPAFPYRFQCDGSSRVKIEPVQEIDRFDIRAFIWSYVVYHSPPGRDRFEDVTTEHLQGEGYATEEEIRESQLQLWEMLRPGV